MIFNELEKKPGARFLFILACLVVIVYGLQFAAPILLPSALALFLAVLSLPVMAWLVNHRIPSGFATLITVLVNVAVIGLLILLASPSVAELQDNLDQYAFDLQERWGQLMAWMENSTGFEISDYLTVGIIDPGAVVDIARGTIGRIAQFLSTTFLVFLIMAFMLSEATVFPKKFRYISGARAGDEDRFTKIATEIQSYLGIKTVVSLATGLVLGIWAYALDLDFPVLLGMIAFLLNYVPTVGSIIAAIPAILLSVITFGTLPHVILVACGYIAVNIIVGNIIEPRWMGRSLGLSTLVVILSLLFWGWAWGPLGALLSVPLTVGVKILLENTEDLRWMAILLDKGPPSDTVAASETVGTDI
ncbi:MAG: AI-2E family transporter [Gemmatimonadota bacterium]|nr:AI-2E family transporter [Gemmatimonadota bacterium]MEC9318187.1 AI-2E family transporter [Gemmatimonadota bacterium]